MLRGTKKPKFLIHDNDGIFGHLGKPVTVRFNGKTVSYRSSLDLWLVLICPPEPNPVFVFDFYWILRKGVWNMAKKTNVEEGSYPAQTFLGWLVKKPAISMPVLSAQSLLRSVYMPFRMYQRSPSSSRIISLSSALECQTSSSRLSLTVANWPVSSLYLGGGSLKSVV